MARSMRTYGFSTVEHFQEVPIKIVYSRSSEEREEIQFLFSKSNSRLKEVSDDFKMVISQLAPI